MRRMILATLAMTAFAATATTAAAQDKGKKKEAPPPPLPMKEVSFPAFGEMKLRNGAQVVVVENHEQPVVSINIFISGAGTTLDPETKTGVANLTATLLDDGTATRTSKQIAETLEGIGARVSTTASQEWATVSLTTLRNDLDAALTVVADLLLNPTFPADEFETARKRLLTSLQVALSQPSQLASRQFQARVFGGHPYGRLETTTSLRGLTREDLVAFHKTYYKPSNALIVVAGDINATEANSFLEKHLAAWTGEGPARPKFAPANAPAQREIILVNKPGAVQAAFRIGHTIVPATHPDWAALTVANYVLGGGPKAWLFDVLRDQKGYTYGAYSAAVQRKDPGFFQLAGDVRNEVADSAFVLFFELAEKLRTAPVPAADLELAKSYLAGSFPVSIETPSQIASQVASALLLGQPKDHVQTWRQRLAAVTAADVQRVARAHMNLANPVIVISGDASVLQPKLEKFGKITIVDEEGRPVTPTEVAAKPSTVTIDASVLKPMTLVYGVTFQGTPVAEMTSIVTREQLGGKDVVKVVANTTGMMTASNELIFEAKSFVPISLNIQMQMGPQTMSQTLTYANGKVTGSVKGPQGEKTINADAPAGTLLSGMDQFALVLANFAANKEVQLPVFNAQTGTVSNFTAKVVGESKVTVPAGTFDVYELDVSAPDGAMKVFVSKTTPQLIVKQEFAAQPVVMELKSTK